MEDCSAAEAAWVQLSLTLKGKVLPFSSSNDGARPGIRAGRGQR